MLIQDVLKSKARPGVVTVSPQTSIAEVAAVLVEQQVGAAVVSDDGRSAQGLVSERDVVRALAEGRLDRRADEQVTETLVTCAPGDRVEALAETMTERRVRHVPVIADGQMVGLVSIGDIVKYRIEQLHAERAHLETYISG